MDFSERVAGEGRRRTSPSARRRRTSPSARRRTSGPSRSPGRFRRALGSERAPGWIARVAVALMALQGLALGPHLQRPVPEPPAMIGADPQAVTGRFRLTHPSAQVTSARAEEVRSADPAAPTRTDVGPPRRSAAASSGSSGARARFEQRFPAQAAATQDASRDPASTRWAVLVGVNDHSGRTRDNVGSRQDAEDLYRHLRRLGWREDHIVLLRDRQANRENILEAIAWLARKTNGQSLAVFHYSGHVKQWHGRNADKDREVPDEGLWPSDNRHIPDGLFVARMAAVKAGWMWVSIAGCEAEGFNDPGLRRKGRILTFSSREPEKSYEDPSRGNSVWGYYFVQEALLEGRADRDGDGDVTIEEAFAYSAPKAAWYTSRASHGSQNGVMFDDAGSGGFSLRIPPLQPPPSSADAGQGCQIPLLCNRSSSG